MKKENEIAGEVMLEMNEAEKLSEEVIESLFITNNLGSFHTLICC